MKYHINAENLVRIMKGIRPYGAIIFHKFCSSEVPCSIPVPVKVKFGAKQHAIGSHLHAKLIRSSRDVFWGEGGRRMSYLPDIVAYTCKLQVRWEELL